MGFQQQQRVYVESMVTRTIAAMVFNLLIQYDWKFQFIELLNWMGVFDSDEERQTYMKIISRLRKSTDKFFCKENYNITAKSK